MIPVRNITPNLMDRVVGYFAPGQAAKRLRARAAMEIFGKSMVRLGSYHGASKTRRSLSEWNPLGNDADSDVLPDLPALRERSRDLIRNNPLANGAIKTKVTNVVGTGLRLQARLDRDVVPLSDDDADAWESKTEREWRLFWDSKDVDVARTLTGTDITRMAYQQAKENGDVVVLLPRVRRKNAVYDLRIQLIEADRLCNDGDAADTDTLAGGIRRDEYGAPVEYQILKTHPGSLMAGREWEKRAAFGKKTGLRNVIHLFNPTRPGQTRGVPDLAAVIEPLKQLSRYTEAELIAAVISGMFTVFIETESGDGSFSYADDDGESSRYDDENKKTDKMKLGNGSVVGLAPGEKVHDANPGRPNSQFDAFVMAVLRQVGTAIEIPFEILIKHFTASYSASRAALLELWKYVLAERRWITDNFLKLIYEIWMTEAVAMGRIAAPGFLTDPAIRAAYLGCEFIGPSKGQINELMEVKASAARLENGLSTLADETAQLTGKDWERNHKQQTKERKKRLEAGLIQDAVQPQAPAQQEPEKEDAPEKKGKTDEKDN